MGAKAPHPLCGPCTYCSVKPPRINVTVCFFVFYQEKDLKQYMDDCGGIMSMSNVRVSNPFWHFKPNTIHTCMQMHTHILSYMYTVLLCQSFAIYRCNGPFAAMPTGTSKTKQLHQDKFEFSLSWMSQWAACPPEGTM